MEGGTNREVKEGGGKLFFVVPSQVGVLQLWRAANASNMSEVFEYILVNICSSIT